MKKLKLSMFILLLLIGVFSCKDDDDKTVHVAKIELDKQELSIEEGSSVSLKSHIVPESATNKHVDWHSTNEEIVTVKDGLINAHKPGDATISAVAEDRDITAKCLVHVTKKVIKVSSVSLDKKELEIIEGEKIKLVATILPKDASNKTITWTSSDEKIASVSDGEITAIKAGVTNITATTKDGKKIATCKVSVKAIAVTSISLNKKELEINVGNKETLVATILPENASDKTITWTSSDEKIASVSDSEITAIKAGVTNITATTKDGNKIATCKVTVNFVKVLSISLDKYIIDLEIGETFTIVPKILPTNATNKKVIWLNENIKIASVVDGKVTAISAGKTLISVQCEDNDNLVYYPNPYRATTCICTVRVKAKKVNVSSVSLDKTKLELNDGDKAQLIATVLPENANNKKVEWTSSNKDIATVLYDGTIYTKGVGECIITVTTKDGSKTATCNLIVKKKLNM